MGADEARTTVTRLLTELQAGNDGVVGELFELLYEELRWLAHRQRQRWRGDHTLNTTALIHEAYLKLVNQSQATVESRTHFCALAARAMRHILCNYARNQRARKRGGDLQDVPFEEPKAAPAQVVFSSEQSDIIVALDDALRSLEQVDPRRSRVVECRFFGGLSVDETAAALGVSSRTVRRDWVVAQAWLHRELKADR